MMLKTFNAKQTLQVKAKEYAYFSLGQIPEITPEKILVLPYSIRVLLEGIWRNYQLGKATLEDVQALAAWQAKSDHRQPIPFFAGRVILQDFTGVPVLNDLVAMRAAVQKMNQPPEWINPRVPVDLVVDHSVQVDYYGDSEAFAKNSKIEFERNRERYEFLHWCQKSFENLRIVPPASGIVHQVNLEYLASGVLTKIINGESYVFPDTLVGTDSHTTMINGLGIAGWGVGGIEATAAILGEPIEILAPDVIGLRLEGQLPEGVTPTDLTLTITQLLRKQGVVNKIVECYGPALDTLALADRAMIANMTPETGATMIYFPLDDQTLDYYRLTDRTPELVERIELYYKAQHLFRNSNSPEPKFTLTLHLDLSTIEPSVAGPKRPQDRIPLGAVKTNFHKFLTAPLSENGYAIPPADGEKKVSLLFKGQNVQIGHGTIVLAAITSCTNTSNPFVMVMAGLVAKKAVEKGLSVPAYVKTSLAPGSKVVTEYLDRAGLIQPLAQLGFSLVGYGCTTCIGNAGPLDADLVKGIQEGNLVVGAVLSGNRNFEGRVSPHTRANYLASPPLVVAYALAGTINIDLAYDSLGVGKDNLPVYLKDIWPTHQETLAVIQEFVHSDLFKDGYDHIFAGSEEWKNIQSPDDVIYPWSEQSSYLREPPFYHPDQTKSNDIKDIRGARVLVRLGDSITTDHISPAGTIAENSPAGRYLKSLGVSPADFNSYGSRRGNDQVMTRGTYANARLKNLLLQGVEGAFTRHFPDGNQMEIYDAAMQYQSEDTPLIVLAGKEYGTGSSRDWAAKGVLLLGVKAVIAESFERIHRSNLAGVGVLPLQYFPGQNAAQLNLTGSEIFAIEGLAENLKPSGQITVRAKKENGSEITFPVRLRLDTRAEVEYYLNGGILNTLLHQQII